MTITATYSPEDNKIRLYPSERLDAATYERVKDAGFKWAPKQELFVAPKWTTKREDLAIELAGEIELEEMTLAERAAAKVERLEGLADKRADDANRFARAANELSRSFEFGQPILVGHHSEAKARKTQQKMHAASDKSAKAAQAVNYWNYRASGVEHFANRKNAPAVRARRIKTLLAELRDRQKDVNHLHNTLAILGRNVTDEQIIKLVNIGHILTGPLFSFDTYTRIERGEITPQELRTKHIDQTKRALASGFHTRWISHILNRLAFERDQLGEIVRHEGELRETAIQMFAREHGAQKPKATKTETGYILESSAPLPAHIADGKTLELDDSEWRDLMRDCGYSVPNEKRNAKPPLLNIDVPAVMVERFRDAEKREVVHLTKAQHKEWAKYGGGWVETSTCGQFRVRTIVQKDFDGPRYQAPQRLVFITDSKAHDAPESAAIITSEGAAS